MSALLKPVDLFDYAAAREAGMIRAGSPPTSLAAAARVQPVRSSLQDQVYQALVERGPMTDGQLEKLPQFKKCAPSTVRKRRSELLTAGRVENTGETRGRLTVWRAVSKKAGG